MSYVETLTSSGLIVAEESMDFHAVAESLRRYRDDLRLVPKGVDRNGKIVFQVMAYRGTDQPAISVFHGMTEDLKEALPLSSRFLDEVRKLDLNTRGLPSDPDAHNERLRAKRDAEAREVVMDIAREAERRSKISPCLPRGQSLKMARDKDRAEGRRI